MKIAIGGDHAGFEYKSEVIKHLEGRGFEVEDFGPFNNESCDYPDHVHPVAKDVLAEKSTFGILICGSGNGVSMTANKYQDIRAALCWLPELAELARSHNNANVLSIPARFVDLSVAIDMVNTFVDTEFEGGRHERRVEKMPAC